eukprot:1157491-Pelagomonas_calceolata.AAC.9
MCRWHDATTYCILKPESGGGCVRIPKVNRDNVLAMAGTHCTMLRDALHAWVARPNAVAVPPTATRKEMRDRSPTG